MDEGGKFEVEAGMFFFFFSLFWFAPFFRKALAKKDLVGVFLVFYLWVITVTINQQG